MDLSLSSMDSILSLSPATGAHEDPSSSSSQEEEDSSSSSPSSLYYKKVNIPLDYPPESLKKRSDSDRTHIYPPLMSPSRLDFNSSSPINIPQRQSQGQGEGRGQSRHNQNRSFQPVQRAGSLPTLTARAQLPSPPTSPWKATRFQPLTRSATVMVVDETPYPDLPTQVRSWTSSHVAEYLAYSLRLYPRAVTEDLGRYVRQTACLNGAEFIDLQEEDLERMGINQKWRKLITKAVGMLRRETLRASRIDSLQWEDGYDPDKDKAALSSSVTSTTSTCSMELQDQDSHSPLDPTPHPHSRAPSHSHSRHHSNSYSHSHSHSRAHSQVNPTMTDSIATSTSTSTEIMHPSNLDPQELRASIVDDIAALLQVWKEEQEAKAKKAAEAASSGSGMGFMEGVVVGGLIVAFMIRFSR